MGDWKYEDFFFEELMPQVEDSYRIKKEKRFRAVAGLSMGGGGFISCMHCIVLIYSLLRLH